MMKALLRNAELFVRNSMINIVDTKHICLNLHKTILIFLILNVIKLQAQNLEDCSSCLYNIISQEQVKNLSLDDIRFLTNDLYARKGYKFKSIDIDAYYSDKVWYKPISDNDKIVYNAVEKQNIKFFQNQTFAIRKERELLINELKNLKTTILANDLSTLSSKYSYSTTDDSNEGFIYLKDAFSKIELNDIHWSFDIGLYKVTVDNGDVVIDYEIRITRDGFGIKYGNRGGSEIGKQLYPNDQITEFTFWWNFEWKNNRIRFLKMDAAG